MKRDAVDDDVAHREASDMETAAMRLARIYNLDCQLTLKDILPEGDTEIPWARIREDLGKGVGESSTKKGV